MKEQGLCKGWRYKELYSSYVSALVYVWLEILGMFQRRREFSTELIPHSKYQYTLFWSMTGSLPIILFIEPHLQQQEDTTQSELWVGFPMPHHPLLNLFPKLSAESGCWSTHFVQWFSEFF